MHQDVILVRRETTQQTGVGQVLPMSHGSIMSEEGKQVLLRECRDSERSNQQIVLDALKEIIPSLKHQAGQIQIRVLFGTFGLVKFPSEQNKAMSVRDFVHRVSVPGIKGQLIRECVAESLPSDLSYLLTFHSLRIRHGWDIVANYLESCALFEKREELVEADSIQARFVIKRVDKPDVRYVQDVKKSLTGAYELGYGAWSRDDGRDIRTPVSIYMVRLNG